MRSALWLTLLAAGCARETTIVLEASDAPTVIVIDEASRAQAIDLGAGGALRLELDEGSHRLTALGYHETLAELGLGAGPLTISDRGGVLPAPFRADAVEVNLHRSSGWARLDPIPAQLRALQVAERSPCFGLEATAEVVPGSVDRVITMLAPLDERTALLGLDDGRFFYVRRGALELIALPGAPVAHLAGALDADGQLWLVGAGSGVFRGTLEAGLTRVADRSIPETAYAIAVSGAPGAIDTLVMTASVGLERFDGQRWQQLRASQRPPASHGSHSVQWTAPGRFISTSPEASEVLEIDETSTVRAFDLMLPETTSTDAVLSLGLSPDFGPLLGTSNGLVFANRNGHWAQLPVRSEMIDAVYAIVPIAGRGLLLGGRRSTLDLWFEGHGDCGFVSAGLGRNTRFVVNLGVDIVAAARGSDLGEPALVSYLRRN